MGSLGWQHLLKLDTANLSYLIRYTQSLDKADVHDILVICRLIGIFSEIGIDLGSNMSE